ncbi:MAG: site-specific DNA-methyltransferase, partial [Candidatus Dojkabacteria bacterium]
PALKSLLPKYSGKIKCIYIDPPYNTGEEGWVYNDNVNSPLIRQWIKDGPVGRDDLTRHDKWLTMITPRLKLLRDLLSKDGAIFISIDENEIYNLIQIMNEIFGDINFVANLTLLCNPKGRSQDKYFASNHEYIVVYSRTPLDKGAFSVAKDEDQIEAEYTLEDEGGKYRLLELRNTHREFGKHNRKNLYYPLYVNPENEQVSVNKSENLIPILPDWEDGFNGCWTWDKNKVERDVDLLTAKMISGKSWKIYRKNYANGSDRMLKTILINKEYFTEKGQKELNSLFGTKDRKFPSPKSVELIKDLISTITKDNGDIVLDAFAGSGTTAQALLEKNEEDELIRKFILIQMPESSEKEPNKNIAKDITRERVIKVIEKKLKNKEIGFEYQRVGQPIDAETILSGNLPSYEQLAKYVYYLATGQSPKEKEINESKYFAGKIGNTEIYLIYKPNLDELKTLALTFDWAKELPRDSKKIVYAPACFIDDEYLEQFNIKFVSIPYNLFERQK